MHLNRSTKDKLRAAEMAADELQKRGLPMQQDRSGGPGRVWFGMQEHAVVTRASKMPVATRYPFGCRMSAATCVLRPSLTLDWDWDWPGCDALSLCWDGSDTLMVSKLSQPCLLLLWHAAATRLTHLYSPASRRGRNKRGFCRSARN